ncbi:MAG: hypothetical protein AAFQ98_07390, partial [Bacteroidota bacterium]
MTSIKRLALWVSASLLLLSTLGTTPVHAQAVQLSQTEQIHALAKVWGFLKYYHPNVANGGQAWDETLLRWLTQEKDLSTPSDLSTFLTQEIAMLGRIPICKRCAEPSKQEVFGQNFDLSWTQEERWFSAALRTQLRFIEANRFHGKFYYAKPGYAKQVTFTHEPGYEASRWSEAPFRLLQLIKFWTAVEYFYPHKYLMERPWAEVLPAMIPRFLTASTELEFHLLLRELTVSLNDSHTAFSSDVLVAYFGERQLPFGYARVEGKIVIEEVYNQDLAALAGYQVGDVILEFEGQTPEARFAAQRHLYAGSNEPKEWDYARIGLLRTQAEVVDLKLERAGEVHTLSVATYTHDEIHLTYSTQDLW